MKPITTTRVNLPIPVPANSQARVHRHTHFLSVWSLKLKHGIVPFSLQHLSFLLLFCLSVCASTICLAQSVRYTEDFSNAAFKDTQSTTLHWAVDEQTGLTLSTRTTVVSDLTSVTELREADAANGAFDSQEVFLVDMTNDAWVDIVFIDAQREVRLWTNDAGVFSQSRVIISSDQPIYDAVLVDVDRDGDWDVVTVTSLKVTVYENSQGQFRASDSSLPLNALGRARAMTAGDWDDDGDDDVAIAYDNLGVFLITNSDGVLEDAGFIDTSEAARFALLSQDVNGDGVDDLVAGHFNQANVVYFGQSRRPLNGRFTFDDAFATRDLAVGDFNNDGTLDIWDAAYGNSYVMAAREDGVSYLASPTDRASATGDTPSNDNTEQVLVWDMDHDGDLDSIELQNGAQPVTLWQKSDANRSLVRYSVASELVVSSAQAIALADVDRDGDMDMVIARNGVNQLRYNEATAGTATATALSGVAQSININTDAMDVSAVTLSVAGAAAFANAQFSISLDGGEQFRYVTPGKRLVLSPTVTAPDIRWRIEVDALSAQPSPVVEHVFIDLEGPSIDQAPIVTAKAGAWSGWMFMCLVVLASLRHGSMAWMRLVYFSAQRMLTAFVSCLLVIVAPQTVAEDLSEIVTSTMVDDGYFVQAPLLGEAYFATAMTQGDLDGDGDQDVVVGNVAQGLQIFENLGAATQAIGYAQHSILPYSDITALAAADVNGDGRDDIAFTTSTQVFVLKTTSADGEIAFRAVSQISNQGLSPRDVMWLDIDADGDDDLVVANQGLPLSFYLNGGDSNGGGNGNLGVRRNFVSKAYTAEAIDAVDINADGRMDLVLANQNQPNVLLTQGASFQFTELVLTSTTSNVASAVFIADIAGDEALVIVIGADDGHWIYRTDANGAIEGSELIVQASVTEDFALAALTANSDCQRFLIAANTGAQDTVRQLPESSASPSVSAWDPAVATDARSSLSRAIVVDDADGDGDDDLLIASPGALQFYHNRLSELTPGLCETQTATALSALPTVTDYSVQLIKQNGSVLSCDGRCYAKAGDIVQLAFSWQGEDETLGSVRPAAVVYNQLLSQESLEVGEMSATASYTFKVADLQGQVPMALNLGRFGVFENVDALVFYDDMPPETPTISARLVEGDTPTVTVSVQSNEAGEARIQLIVDEAVVTERISVLDVNFSAIEAIDISDTGVYPQDTTITVSVVMTDRAGNVSVANTRSVIKVAPNTAPIVTAKAGAWPALWWLLCTMGFVIRRQNRL